MDAPAQPAMSRFLGMALLGGAVLVAAPVPGAEPPGSGVTLRASAIEFATVPAPSFELMTRELDALLAGTGVRLRWRRAGPTGETSADELRVVFLDAPGRGAHADRPILAASGPAAPAPTIWVYMPTVAAALDLPGPTPLQSFLGRRALGVALGRVLAHELVHLLAPEVPHGTGVMAPRFRLAELGSGRMAYDNASARALANAAAAWYRRGGPPPEEVRRGYAALAARAASEGLKAR